MADYYLGSGTFKKTSNFGMRHHPVHGGQKMHNGVDFAAKAGTPIQAVMDGVVKKVAFQKGGAGNYIEIQHSDGTISRYMHMLNASPLREGERVGAGQVIGKVGSTGASTGNHLHLEMRDQHGKAFDPMSFLSDARQGKKQVHGYKPTGSPFSLMGAAKSLSSKGKIPNMPPMTSSIHGWVAEASKTHKVREELIYAVMAAESGFRPNVKSGAGAYGLMQLMPHFGKGRLDPKQNVTLGAGYLSYLMNNFSDIRLVLAAYNAGPGRVKGLTKKYGSDWNKIQSHLPSETRKYVAKIEGYLRG